jgi:hypothetical protein
MDSFFRAAIEEAECGLAEGGIPIGSVAPAGTRAVSTFCNFHWAEALNKLKQWCESS